MKIRYNILKTLLGIIIIIVSAFGIIYFKNYKGTIIPFPALWLIGFILLEILGVYLTYLSLYKQQRTRLNKLNYELENFKALAEQIELIFDNCQFKNGSFSHEIEDPKFSSVKYLVPNPSPLSFDSTITETVVRSYLIYSYPPEKNSLRYISQSFPFDETTLRFYVLGKKITLYIDRFNKEKYFFELKE